LARHWLTVAAFIATAFAQGEAGQPSIQWIEGPPNAEAASVQWRTVADQIRPKVPKLATIMDGGGHRPNEHDVLTTMSFPEEHRTKLHCTDEMDKRCVGSCAILSWRGRPRGEERRIGCERRRVPHSSLAGLRRSRTPSLGGRAFHWSTKRS